ncbi:hypothetical protein COU61_03830, partial [Candidatus Pacearchaeota archaeon CG10_big_fil_rev_8_21_14_0_10_35_13]
MTNTTSTSSYSARRKVRSKKFQAMERTGDKPMDPWVELLIDTHGPLAKPKTEKFGEPELERVRITPAFFPRVERLLDYEGVRGELVLDTSVLMPTLFFSVLRGPPKRRNAKRSVGVEEMKEMNGEEMIRRYKEGHFRRGGENVGIFDYISSVSAMKNEVKKREVYKRGIRSICKHFEEASRLLSEEGVMVTEGVLTELENFKDIFRRQIKLYSQLKDPIRRNYSIAMERGFKRILNLIKGNRETKVITTDVRVLTERIFDELRIVDYRDISEVDRGVITAGIERAYNTGSRVSIATRDWGLSTALEDFGRQLKRRYNEGKESYNRPVIVRGALL